MADLVVGDRGKLVRTIRNAADDSLFDLTGKTVTLKYKINGGALQSKAMTVQNPGTNGRAEYQFAANDLTAGELEGEIVIQEGLADQLTTLSTFHIPIRARLA